MRDPNLIFTFDPNLRERTSNKRTREPKGGPSSWTAPEHAKGCKGLERDSHGDLILDSRPEILRPRREVRFMF